MTVDLVSSSFTSQMEIGKECSANF